MDIPRPLSSFPLALTLFDAAVCAGFPSPAADFAQQRINLNDYLLLNEQASFMFRVSGDSMCGIGIYSGDILIVDRSIVSAHNHIVLAIVDEEFTVKRLFRRGAVLKLLPENPAFSAIEFKEGQELRIWGVVTFNLHRLLNV
ncbi:translesion error-prone DNA polymerase V autoproteolytic subunit [Herbaspirillum sp. RTI4]|uniref:LexA family protein n=1 Tax=Herbaspirillum sp. RTI4 TaxID=3048640 RepID=UPI002AB49486|nr:translesion error-prone DNA polymerase V autoproteolytic subunit [Herbaspirillum sp. RTI4]MDY7579942.1 translesion error-prone DNA polymerase V autoproteolytic subunit [Herbaspirillum sp. RTI4]MEA9982914.1 translesion error-prone DNA polymerase V autoproteolytic subunit [Herbaspirillum sp. RTI4]